MLDFLKKLWEPLSRNLRAQILVFGTLVLILEIVLLLILPPVYDMAILIGMAVTILIVIAVYAFAELRVERQKNQVKEQGSSTGITLPTPEGELSSPPSISSPSVVSIESLRNNYLSGMIETCRRARLVGLDPQAADVTRGAFALDKLYVSLDTRTQVEVRKAKREKAEQQSENTRPLSALEALAKSKECCVVLLGSPGSGKSTFVRYLSLRHAQALCHSGVEISKELPGWKGAAIIPVIVPLGRLAESLPAGAQKGNADFIEHFLIQTILADKDARNYAPYFLQDVQQCGGLFLFDGLDEIANLDLRPVVMRSVEVFADRYAKNPASRFLVTCRIFSYTDQRWQLTGWPTHELAPLSEEKISQFVEAWHNECICVDPARKADFEDKRKRLHESLRRGDPRRLWEIADNPLILTVMAIVHTHKDKLPDARALVYEECVDILLLRWEGERTVTGGKTEKRDLRTALNVPEIVLINALQEIAYHAHERQPAKERGGQAALVTEDLLRADLHAAFGDDKKVQTFLDFCESANGLLLLQGVAPLPGAPSDSPPRRVYAFPHLTFEEYLAARYLRRMKILGSTARNHLDRSDLWREVIMLLGEHICFREGDYEQADVLLDALSPDTLPARPSEKDWRALWMAGDLLMLYRRAFPARESKFAHIPHHLVKMLQTGALSPRERAAAGDTLARLGDPRFDKDAWHLPSEPLRGFVHIPAGKFIMGTKAEDVNGLVNKYGGEKDWFKMEVPQHTLTLPDFYLSRYPVTVAQFKAFVEEKQYKPANPGSVDSLPSQPARYITWFDAMAYCDWLNNKMQGLAKTFKGKDPQEAAFWRGLAEGKLKVTLPSEAEWEKAARGTDGRELPWKGEFNPNNANVEMDIGRASAAGCFPAGQSPYGLLDMSGNVWEWTRSIYKEYPYHPADGREGLEDKGAPRVLRGGVFDDLARLARCASRDRLNPDYRYRFIGFRVVVGASPISGF